VSSRIIIHAKTTYIYIYVVVRQTNMFNDPTPQINELTQLVKQDINIIHTKLDDLQVYIYISHAHAIYRIVTHTHIYI
jgi:hypothetical protein